MRKCGEELLALVRDAGIADPPPPLPRRERPDPAQFATVKRLADIAGAVAVELEIGTEVLATRRELEKLAAGRQRRQPAARLARGSARKQAAVSALTCAARGAPCASTLRATLRTAARGLVHAPGAAPPTS